MLNGFSLFYLFFFTFGNIKHAVNNGMVIVPRWTSGLNEQMNIALVCDQRQSWGGGGHLDG